MVIAFADAMYGARRAVAGAEESRALQRDRICQLPLGRGAERESGGRYAKDLRRDVVVAAVKSPYAFIRAVRRFIVCADEQAAGHHVFKNVRARGGGLKAEIIERTRIGIAGLA